MTRVLNIGIAGLGNVGAEVFRLLRAHPDLHAARTGARLAVTAVSARDKGRDRGLDLSSVTWHDDPVALADDPDVDVVVELMGGATGAAFELIRKSLASGKSVVTANKALLALRGAEVLGMGGHVAYEAAVAGGIPVIKGLREGLAANRIDAVYGILNGTCNYILSEMTATGRAFDAVLKEAQDKGYAEADPAFDIDGVDAGHKLSILAALAFGGVPDFGAVAVRGIRAVAAPDIAFADELGYRIRLLCIARRTPGGIVQSVEPCLVPKDNPVARVDGALNAVYVDGDFSGKILFTGPGAGGRPTASAVVADILDIARGRAAPLFGVDNPAALPPAAAVARADAYFLRLVVHDQPGVIAAVSAILRDHGVSVDSMIQRGRDADSRVSLVILTHETAGDAVRAAAAAVTALPSAAAPPHVMRVETFA